MNKIIVLITGLSICLACSSCKKESSHGNSSNSNSLPVTLANLVGNWRLVNDTTTSIGGIMTRDTPVVGINYIGKASDYYDFTSYGKLNMHDNDVTGTTTYKLSHDTVLAEYAYIYAPTKQVDSAYAPLYVITHLTSHNCTMTAHDTGLELNNYSTINLSR